VSLWRERMKAGAVGAALVALVWIAKELMT
jgi:hypothetical protein